MNRVVTELAKGMLVGFVLLFRNFEMGGNEAGDRFDPLKEGTNNAQAEKITDWHNATVGACNLLLVKLVIVGVETFYTIPDCWSKALLLKNQAHIQGELLQGILMRRQLLFIKDLGLVPFRESYLTGYGVFHAMLHIH